jgi:hypothetical protein
LGVAPNPSVRSDCLDRREDVYLLLTERGKGLSIE